MEIFSKKKEQLLETMRAAIDNGSVVSNPVYILHLYEKRLSEVSLSDVNKETIEEHCKYYGIVTDGKRKNKLWDELRDIIRRGERTRAWLSLGSGWLSLGSASGSGEKKGKPYFFDTLASTTEPATYPFITWSHASGSM